MTALLYLVYTQENISSLFERWVHGKSETDRERSFVFPAITEALTVMFLDSVSVCQCQYTLHLVGIETAVKVIEWAASGYQILDIV